MTPLPHPSSSHRDSIWTVELVPSSNAGFSSRPDLEIIGKGHCLLPSNPPFPEKRGKDINTFSFSSTCLQLLTLLLFIMSTSEARGCLDYFGLEMSAQMVKAKLQ